MANFQAITNRVVEENGVVTGFVMHRTFDFPRAGTFGNFGQAMDLLNAFSPEGDAVLVRKMSRRRGDAKEFSDVGIRGLVLQPAFDIHLSGEAKRGQKGVIKGLDVRQSRRSKV